MKFLLKIKHFLTSWKFIANVLGIILFWIILIWASLRYFKSYTHHEESIEVPSLLMNNINDVPDLMAGKDLKYEIIDSVYNPNLVEGTIVYQDPMPTDSSGLKVKSERTINLRISKQTRLVDIPNVVSKSRRFAEASLVARGLRTKTIFVPSNEDQGSVIEQKVNGKPVVSGMRVPINTLIELIVGEKTGSDLTLVPQFYGLTIKEAENRLANDSSLRLFSVCSDCLTKEDSLSARISSQTPVAGDSSKVPSGSTITVFATTKFLE